MATRAVIEVGPKAKKTAAFALDWPGWSRGASRPELSLDKLAAYRDRYRPIAVSAGLGDDFDAAGAFDVVERATGTGSTDFWGISFAPCSLETEPMDAEELERKIALLRACWKFFDDVAGRVSPEMRKGPRGGGRDRDRIIQHTMGWESTELAGRVGLRIAEPGPTTPAELRTYRHKYVDAMRAYNAGEVARMRSGNLPYLLRHTAFHVMDHAWEMQDKDLSSPA